MDICINSNELIVGSSAGKARGCQVYPEYDMGFIIEELNTFDKRAADRFYISEETKDELRAIYPEWKNNTVADNALALFDDEQKSCTKDLVHILTALKSGVGHVIVDYQKVLEKGFTHISHEIEKYRSELDISASDYASKLSYYESAQICIDAIVAFAGRFSDLAYELSQNEKNNSRKKELITIHENLKLVPMHPAQNFHQALQSFWLVHLALHLEANGHSVSPGRFDQYMYAYYKKDLLSGIKKDDLEEMLHLLWLKFFEINKVRDGVSSIAFGGYPMFQNLIIGGVDKSGKPAINELSYLCMDATKQLMIPQPSLSLRWFFGCSYEFMDKALDVVEKGTGMPAMFNDEILIPNMLQMGYSLEEARDYGIVGCTETTGQGNVEPWLTGGFLNTLKILELTIFSGYDKAHDTRHRYDLKAVEDIKSYEELFETYISNLFDYLKVLVSCDNILDSVHAEICPNPFESLMIEGCLQSGKSSLAGGAKYNSTTIELVGIPNVADSLAAIKYLIYEKRQLSWQQLKNALENDFEDNELLRAKLQNKCLKYGNDEDYVDSIAKEIVDRIYGEIDKYTSPRGGKYRIALYSIASHVLFADHTGATPDGRRFGEVLADGGISCAQGKDKYGLSALLNSVVKIDSAKATGSTLLNVKLTKELFSKSNRPKLIKTIETYFLNKGQHVQFNVIDADMLREAQKDRDRYPNLMVRVAGFSVFFNTIDEKLQNDIIARTEHG
jgi:formate C-acetyltransferase